MNVIRVWWVFVCCCFFLCWFLEKNKPKNRIAKKTFKNDDISEVFFVLLFAGSVFFFFFFFFFALLRWISCIVDCADVSSSGWSVPPREADFEIDWPDPGQRLTCRVALPANPPTFGRTLKHTIFNPVNLRDLMFFFWFVFFGNVKKRWSDPTVIGRELRKRASLLLFRFV